MTRMLRSADFRGSFKICENPRSFRIRVIRVLLDFLFNNKLPPGCQLVGSNFDKVHAGPEF